MVNLLRECRLDLRVCENEDERIDMIIKEGTCVLQNIIHEDIDFSKGHERMLLKNYVRLAFHEAVEDFQHNFSNDINTLGILYAKKK